MLYHINLFHVFIFYRLLESVNCATNKLIVIFHIISVALKNIYIDNVTIAQGGCVRGGPIFPNGNQVFPTENIALKTRTVLEWFQDRNAEFYLMSLEPSFQFCKSQVFNSVKSIWGVMEWQLEV